jgi:flavodoxin
MRPKVLIVFFSRTGTTRLLAEAIARATHGDLEELRERKSRRGVMGWLRSGYEGTYRRAAEILPLRHDVAAYDLVFIGSPTWNQALSSPVLGFLQRRRGQLANVVLFATCAGKGSERVLAQMTELLPEPPLATLGMLENDVRHGPAVWVGELVEAALEAWSRKLAPRTREARSS